jgi:hypothetical protein
MSVVACRSSRFILRDTSLYFHYKKTTQMVLHDLLNLSKQSKCSASFFIFDNFEMAKLVLFLSLKRKVILQKKKTAKIHKELNIL